MGFTNKGSFAKSNPELQDKNFKWIDDFTLADIERIDRSLADNIRQSGAVTKVQYEAFLKKIANKEKMKEYGNAIMDKALQTLLNKTLKVSEGDKMIEIGGGYTPPPPSKKVPMGVWIALSLIVLVVIIFLIAKFGKKT